MLFSSKKQIVCAAAFASLLVSCGSSDSSERTQARLSPSTDALSTSSTPAGTNLPSTPAAAAQTSSRLSPQRPEWLKNLTKETALEDRIALEKDSAEGWVAYRSEFYQWWATLDGPAAFANARDTNVGAATACGASALAGWASYDLQAAQEALQTLPKGADRCLSALGLIQGAPPDQLDEVCNYVATQGQEPSGQSLLSAAALRKAETDWSKAAEWLLALPEPAKNARSMENFFAAWSKSDPRATSEYLAAISKDHPARDFAVYTFASYLRAEDAASAETWAQTLSSPDLKELWDSTKPEIPVASQ